MSLKLITPPAVEPLTVSEAKSFLRVGHAAADGLIASLIQAAREQVEQDTGLALITQTWRYALDAFPWGFPTVWQGGPEVAWTWSEVLELTPHPVQAITSLKYVDGTGVLQTVASTGYVLDAESRPARLRAVYGVTWPAPRTEPGAVRVEFTAGFGAAAANVPATLLEMVRLMLEYLWDRRRSAFSVLGAGSESLPTGVPPQELLEAYAQLLPGWKAGVYV